MGYPVLRQLLRRGQITLPGEMLKQFGLKERGYVQITPTREGILIRPVFVSDYSPAEIESLRTKLDKLPRGPKKIFRSVSESKKYLDSLKTK